MLYKSAPISLERAVIYAQWDSKGCCLEGKVKTAGTESPRLNHASRVTWNTKFELQHRLRNIALSKKLDSDSHVVRAMNDLQKCGSRPTALLNQNASANVTFEMNDTSGSIGVGGLAYCERLTCPLCADRAARQRAAAIIDGVHSRIEKVRQSTAVAVTLTVPHKITDSFEESFRCVGRKLRTLIQFYRALEKRAACRENIEEGLCGYVATFECTVGRNGPHPHWHLLFVMPTPELAEEIQAFVRQNLCDESMGAVGFKRSAEVIKSNHVERMVMYIQKGMFEATGISKSKHKNGNAGLFEMGSDWHVERFAEVHCVAKGKRLFRAGGDLKNIRTEFDEADVPEERDAGEKIPVAVIVTDEMFDDSELPRDCVVIRLDTGTKLKNFCNAGGIKRCVDVLRRAMNVRVAREGIGKIFEEFS